jgi:hypothetical protein
MVKVKKKRDKNGEAHIFTGLLKCGDCGKCMVYNTTSKTNPTLSMLVPILKGTVNKPVVITIPDTIISVKWYCRTLESK